MTGQHRAGEVVEAPRAFLAAVALPVRWLSSQPSRITAAVSHSGQRTPSGQRCWRTKAKHLASSIRPERLTKPEAASDTAMMRGAPRDDIPVRRGIWPASFSKLLQSQENLVQRIQIPAALEYNSG